MGDYLSTLALNNGGSVLDAKKMDKAVDRWTAKRAAQAAARLIAAGGRRDTSSARSASLDTRPSTTNSTGSTCSRKSAWAGRPRQPQRQDDRERKEDKTTNRQKDIIYQHTENTETQTKHHI